jgi:two-component system, NtrC family, C4-dicarboxylate transport response regulator DctD
VRDRIDDVPLLFEYFVSEAARLHARQPKSVDHQELKALLTHAWPGNVRELRNVAERFILSTGSLNLDGVFEAIEMPVVPGATTRNSLAQQLDEVERSLIIDALTRSKGDVRSAMNLLALPRRTLNEKMLRYGIVRQNFAAVNTESKDDAGEQR